MSTSRAAPRESSLALERLMHRGVLSIMNTLQTAGPLVSVSLGLLLACSASPQQAASSPQPVTPQTETPPTGVTSEQAVADEDVVSRISVARCDRSQSCNHIGPGAAYHDRDDCMAHMRVLVSKQLNTTRCPGGLGETGVSRCVKSLVLGQCDMPGQEYPTADHCKVKEMCLK
jgi:hypothetical protein